MKTIFLILIFLILGIFFGLIMARVLIFISNWLLKKKVTKQALNEEERKFFYQDKPYNLKENIEYEQKRNKKQGFFDFLIKRQVKGGVSDYGDTIQPRNNEIDNREQVPTSGSVESTPASPTGTTTTGTTPENRGEQGNPTPPTRGERGLFTRNLFEKGKKLN